MEEEFVFALASLGDPRAVKPFASYFRSTEQNESHRLMAADFLLKFGMVAVPRVIEILESPEAGSVHSNLMQISTREPTVETKRDLTLFVETRKAPASRAECPRN
jgi:hypothetical protein